MTRLFAVFTAVFSTSALCLAAPPGWTGFEAEPPRTESAIASRHQMIDIPAMEERLPRQLEAIRQLEERVIELSKRGVMPPAWEALRAHYQTLGGVEDVEIASARHLIILARRLRQQGDEESTAHIAQSVRARLEESLPRSPTVSRGQPLGRASRAERLETLASVYSHLLGKPVEAEALFVEALRELPQSHAARVGLRRLQDHAPEVVDISEEAVERRRRGRQVDSRVLALLGGPDDE